MIVALLSSKLVDGLRALFEDRERPPADAREAGERWAEIYADYAAGATARGTVPLKPSLDAAQETLARALSSAFESGREAGPAGIATVAPLIDGAFVAFWMAGPMTFSAGPAAGVVTLAPPGVLTAGLTSALASGVTAPSPTAAQQAALIGEALHVWSGTVVATVTPPGRPPVPIL